MAVGGRMVSSVGTNSVHVGDGSTVTAGLDVSVGVMVGDRTGVGESSMVGVGLGPGVAVEVSVGVGECSGVAVGNGN